MMSWLRFPMQFLQRKKTMYPDLAKLPAFVERCSTLRKLSILNPVDVRVQGEGLPPFDGHTAIRLSSFLDYRDILRGVFLGFDDMFAFVQEQVNTVPSPYYMVISIAGDDNQGRSISLEWRFQNKEAFLLVLEKGLLNLYKDYVGEYQEILILPEEV